MTEIAIQNAVQSWFQAVDDHDWTLAESHMQTPFHLDYSSFGGGPGSDLEPAAILKGWADFLPGFDATHHQLGPMMAEIRGDRATVRVYVTASHFIADVPDGQVWTVVGSYDIGLERTVEQWSLSSLTFNFKFQQGNTALPSLARERSAS